MGVYSLQRIIFKQQDDLGKNKPEGGDTNSGGTPPIPGMT
jgi:hypothetical protein